MNEIEKMAKKICKSSLNGCNFPTCSKCGIKDTCKARLYATRAVNAGYGDVKQAVREFADKLLDELCDHCIDNKNVNSHLYDIVQIVKKHRKEVCGE